MFNHRLRMGRENFCVADIIAASCSVSPSSVSIPCTTFVTEYLALSGLNSGVSTKLQKQIRDSPSKPRHRPRVPPAVQ